MKQEIAKSEKIKVKSKKRKIIISIIALVLAVAVAIGGIFIYKSKTNTQTYSFIRTTTLSKGTLDDSISTTGTVVSSKTSNVTTSLQYTVKSIEVKIGDEVEKGDVIATLDTTSLEKQIKKTKENIEKENNSLKLAYENAKQSYENAKSDYESAKSALKTAETSLAKAKNSTSNQSAKQNDGSSEQSTTSYSKAKEEYENAKTALKQAKTALSQANSQLKQAKSEYENGADDSELEELEDNLENCVIKAGQSGTITALNATVGSSCKDTVAKIQDTSKLAIDITIEEADINKAEVGMQCNITTDADDNTYKGTLTQIDPTASDSNNFGATVTVDSSDTSLKIGIDASVEIVVSSTDDVYQVPIDAVGEDDTGSFVYRQTGGSGVDMTFEKVYVTLGQKNDYYVEIEADDLNSGDVIRSSSDLTQGIETQESDNKSSNKFSLFGNFGSSMNDDKGGQMPQQNGGNPPSNNSNQGANPPGDMNNGGGGSNE